ncbi:hypothetical protein BC938DRAFT_472481, partial [Jimgerdemannia flammicorona]
SFAFERNVASIPIFQPSSCVLIAISIVAVSCLPNSCVQTIGSFSTFFNVLDAFIIVHHATMKLKKACTETLTDPEYWANIISPSLASFLEYREKSFPQTFLVRDKEHLRYKAELEQYGSETRTHKKVSHALRLLPVRA